MKRNNPAARLYGLLFEARRKQQESKVREIWAELFGVDATNTTAVLEVHTDLLRLIADARAAVASLDDVDGPLYMRPFDQIEKAFANANLEIKWKQLRDQIDDTTMARLELVAETLGRMAPERLADEDELVALQAEVEALYESVVASKLEQQLKSVVLEALDSILRAVRTYEIFGIRGLVDALTRSAGIVLQHEAELRAKSDNENIERFFTVLGRLNEIVALATNAKHALGRVMDMLGLPSGE